MTSRIPAANTTFRWAQPKDAAAATDLWRTTARWLENVGQSLWHPDEFTEANTRAAIAEQQLLVGIDTQGICACVLITDSDEYFWPEQPAGTALYVHKLAIAQRSRGQRMALQVLSYVESLARSERITHVRLDCEPRKPLLALYTSCGFTYYDPEPVQRGEFCVQRFEKEVLINRH